MKAEGQEGNSKGKLIKPKIIPKAAPKITSRILPRVGKTFGQLRDPDVARQTPQFALYKQGDRAFKEGKYRPRKNYARVAYEEVTANNVDYSKLNDTGKKAYWSYRRSWLKHKPDNLNIKAQQEYYKYAGFDYAEDKTKTAQEKETAEDKAFFSPGGDALVQPTDEQRRATERQDAERSKIAEKTAKMGIARPGKPVYNTNSMQQDNARYGVTPSFNRNPRALPLTLTQSDKRQAQASEMQRKQESLQAVDNAIKNPTLANKLMRGAVSGSTAGISERGMSQEQKARYQQAMNDRQTVSVPFAGPASVNIPNQPIRMTERNNIGAYGVGQMVGSIATLGTGSAALRGAGMTSAAVKNATRNAPSLVRKVVGEGKVAAEIARDAVSSTPYTIIQSTNEGASVEETVKNVLLNIGLSALGGAALGGMSKKIASSVGDTVTASNKEAIHNAIKVETDRFKVMNDGNIYKDGNLIRKSSKINNEVQAVDNIGMNRPGESLVKRIESPLQNKNNVLKTTAKDNIDPTLYHGTGQSFENFDKAKQGINYRSGEGGFFFTNNEKVAGNYAKISAGNTNGKERIIAAKLDIKKPLTVGPYDDAFDFYDQHVSELLHDADNGTHDGVIVKSTNGKRDLYVAFEPNQITKHSVDSSSIAYSKGEITNINKTTLAEQYAMRKNTPPTIASEPSKISTGTSNPPVIENTATTNTAPKTQVRAVSEKASDDEVTKYLDTPLKDLGVDSNAMGYVQQIMGIKGKNRVSTSSGYTAEIIEHSDGRYYLNITDDAADGAFKPTIFDHVFEYRDDAAKFASRKIGELSKARNATTKETVMDAVKNPTGKPLGSSIPDENATVSERGFSKNIRTDSSMPDDIRQSYDTNPDFKKTLSNQTTLDRANKSMAQGFEKAKSDFYSSDFKAESVPLAKMLAKQARDNGNLADARQILSYAGEKLTTAGQISQAAKILREADPETFFMTMDKILKNLNVEGKAHYGNKWNDVSLTEAEATKISSLKTGDEKAYEAAMNDISDRVSNEIPSTAWEQLVAYRRTAMLLNPKTHIRNIGGNGIMYLMRTASEKVATAMQKVLPKSERTLAFKISNESKDLAEEVYNANRKDLLEGNKYNEGSFKAMNREKKVFKGIASPMNKVSQMNFDLLSWGDEIFYKPAYIDRLANYLEARGIKNLEDVPADAMATAKKEADEATYKDVSMLANMLNKWKNPVNKTLASKTLAMGTEVAMPFAKTPINIAKRGIQYSPLGIMNGISKARNKGEAVHAIDDIAKGLTGTAISIAGYYMAKSGILTGKSDKDSDVAEYDKSTGNAPFSILGKFTYDWAQPFAAPLAVGVEFYRAMKQNPAAAKKMEEYMEKNNKLGGTLVQVSQSLIPIAQSLLEGLQASGDTIFNMSVLRNIQSLLGGQKGLMENLSEMPSDFVTSLIPSVFGQTAGMIDPTVRQTYYTGDMARSTVATIKSKIPGLSKTLEPKQTPYGEDVRRLESPMSRILQQSVSPGIIAKPQIGNESVDKEIRRLQKTTGLTTHFPTMLKPKLSLEGYNLTPEQLTRYQRMIGTTTARKYEQAIQTKEYREIRVDEDKVKFLSNIIADVKKDAKAMTLKQFGVIPKK